MDSSTYIVIIVVVNFFAIRICNKIDLKDRKNTNTVVYIIGYLLGVIITIIDLLLIRR